MRTTWFRIFSAIALITIVMMFSGLASTIDAAQTAKIETASDNHSNPDSPHECPIPCDTQICPLCICIIADAVLPLELQANFHITELTYRDVPEAILDPFIVEIFHPPTLSPGVS